MISWWPFLWCWKILRLLFAARIDLGNHRPRFRETKATAEAREAWWPILDLSNPWSFVYSFAFFIVYFGHFIKRKNRTLTALSNFREFLKNKHSLESLNTIFRIRSPKGIFGQNMSHLPNGLLCITAMINVFLNIHTFKLLYFKRREEGGEKWVEIEGIRNKRVRATMGQITFTKKNNLY